MSLLLYIGEPGQLAVPLVVGAAGVVDFRLEADEQSRPRAQR